MVQDVHYSKDHLYWELMNGFQEMAEDARAEENVLNLIKRYLADPETVGVADRIIMEQKVFDGIAYVWDRMAATVSSHNRVPLKKMQRLLRETYKVLTLFHKENSIPKGITSVLLFMDEFRHQAYEALDYAEEDVKAIAWSQYGGLYDIILTLKDGFFEGEYKTPYPILCVHDHVREKYKIDLINDSLKDLVKDK